MKYKTTIILHSNENNDQKKEDFIQTIQSIVSQTAVEFDVTVLGEMNALSSDLFKSRSVNFHEIDIKDKSYPEAFNEAIQKSDSDYVLYIDNRNNPVILRNAALEAFLMAAVRNQNTGLFYTDYDLKDKGITKEIKLLFHHIGRLRDNQDYGKVFFLKKEALENASFFDESLKFNFLYDLRLKISEQYKLTRISNKYNGSFYTVIASGKAANVFDYLLADREVQVEAEKIVTDHLKRIGAYLPPDKFYPIKTHFDDISSLKASVIIPVGFRPEFIGTAIESIQAQTVQDIEAIIVVNGGDEDPTIAVVKKFMHGGEYFDPDKPNVRLIVVDINSIGFCLNLGANVAKGRYYVQLDSDDRLKPDAVEKIMDCFDSDADIGMVIGSYEVWEKNEEGTLSRMDEIPVVTHDEWTDENGRNNLLRINGAGAPRAIPIHVIKEVGYFGMNDDAFSRNYGEDYEMVNKIADYYKIGRVYDPVYEVIRHSGGTDHAISQDIIDLNDEAKDDMRKEIILRRIKQNTLVT
jgi:glycosyltransferase involved in cell wall biosynthesis